MLNEFKVGLRFTLVTMALLGGAYHAVLWGVGRIVFPAQAEGSLVRRPDGAILGSRLLAQRFARPEYFRPRPSAVDYNAASTGGTRSARRRASPGRCSADPGGSPGPRHARYDPS